MFVQSFRASSFLPSLDWLPIRVKPGEIVVVVGVGVVFVVVVVVVELLTHISIRPGLPTPSPRQGAPSTPVQRSLPDHLIVIILSLFNTSTKRLHIYFAKVINIGMRFKFKQVQCIYLIQAGQGIQFI